MATYRLDIEYDGTAFSGWGRQDGTHTVQGCVERALRVCLRAPEIEVVTAGRTDAGVHALGQVASFAFAGEMPPSIIRSLNGLTPEELAIRAVTRVEDSFDARRDAVSRTYCYRIFNRKPGGPFAPGRAWWISRHLDREALDHCAGLIRGRHDFTAFTPTETYHTRFERLIVSARWIDEPGLVDPASGASLQTDMFQFWITGESFLRSMVRVLVGTMVEVADGSRSLENFAALLEGAERPAAGMTAPAEGLTMVRVDYPEPPARRLPGTPSEAITGTTAEATPPGTTAEAIPGAPTEAITRNPRRGDLTPESKSDPD